MKLSTAKLVCLGLAAVRACEFECEPPAVACRALEIDVIFALDDSGSMQVADWENQRQFTKLLATGMSEKFGGTRLGLVQWASGSNVDACPAFFQGVKDPIKVTNRSPCIRVPLDWKPTGTLSAFDNFITVLTALKKSGGGSTPTEDAFNTCGQHFKASERQDSGGSLVQQLCVVVTDGGATTPTTAESAAVALKKNLNIKIMMVGVGKFDPNNSQQTVLANQITLWASEPKVLYRHTASDFSTVISVTLPQIIASVCFFVGEIKVGSGNSKCAIQTDTVTVVGSGFVNTGTAFCLFKSGSQEGSTTATIKSITEATCQVPPFADENSVPKVEVPDPLNPPPHYFTERVYTLELRMTVEGAIKMSKNGNLIQLRRDCTGGGSAVVKDEFNPFAPGAADGSVDGNAVLPPTEDPGRTTREVDISSAASLAPGVAIALFAAAVAAFF